MRDLLNDLDSTTDAKPSDPTQSARASMRASLPKRFYTHVGVVETGEGFAVQLDGKPVRTPGKSLLVLPSAAAAELVAAEFSAQADEIDPMSMPVLRLANSAIDGVVPDPQAVLEDVTRFSGSDLVCYRADGPQALVTRQAAAWDPVLEWAHAAMGARFFLAEGVVHVRQPEESIAAVGSWLQKRGHPFRIAAIHVMTTLTGSALLAIAIDAGAISPDEGWSAAHVDEDWNIDQWGGDAEAIDRRAVRRRDFDGAVALARAFAL